MSEHSNASVDHLIAHLPGDPSGPILIAFGSVHGNESAGAKALERAAAKIRAMNAELKGIAYFFAGNTRALAKGVRFIDMDLNRHWTTENVLRNLPDSNIPPQFSEDAEQAELLAAVLPIFKAAKNEIYALDLHSTSAEGVPFATVGDTMRNRRFAQKFPIRLLLGIEEQLEGTTLEYMSDQGGVTLGYEGGQHYADSTVDVHEALVMRAMVNAGILDDSDEMAAFDELLRQASGTPAIYEVRYRHAITPEDDFRMRPGFNNFDPIAKGDPLATDARGPIDANEGGVLLMPLYQKLGEDGFFIGRRVASFWLWLSGVLRRLHIGDMIHWLPGVRRSGKSSDVLEIDTAVARFFPLQIFHLLGFRKLRWRDEKLIVTRRRYDFAGPFTKM